MELAPYVRNFSMARYHIEPSSGLSKLCRAQPGNCPFGGEHYSSPEQARRAFEESQNGSFNHRESGGSLLGPHGFLRREFRDEVPIRDLRCPQCGELIDGRNAWSLLSYGDCECACGESFFMEELDVQLTESNPSYIFLDTQAVKDAVWYHATSDAEWLENLEDDAAITGYLQAHLGTRDAALDRAIANYVPHRAHCEPFYLYRVQLAPDATIADEIKQDENDDARLEAGSDVTRYINRWEDMASISLAVRSDKLQIIDRQLCSKEDAYERLSVYNLPPDDATAPRGYWREE